jgi:hypothetical protein
MRANHALAADHTAPIQLPCSYHEATMTATPLYPQQAEKPACLLGMRQPAWALRGCPLISGQDQCPLAGGRARFSASPPVIHSSEPMAET